MRTVSTSSQTSKGLSVSLDPILTVSLVFVSLFVIYIVGLEPMPELHASFHDIRHATGFPCH
ncbi:cobalt transporter subunit CbtB [Leptospira kmetyi]|uniref:CbtB-domain containing protein n=1 Tax=Leptospira kmetyi TaxID=408139 RepID=A0A2M9XR94_9LEPT|nr:CbtB-domain containing protein [Leptospira kmetyi]AYV57958.1 CbtB-domain containing protein [Leptospira kmetyi]EQA55633.1 putative cobalt transporter subunit CbtB (proposed) [Leptospira kmetyi serovar Malaysia str. Bejo-Iso9]PJZ41829.1 cobalt transporter subunit CbtB [Leptospira kmetyi]TGK14914.1 CbtB-domain containing protein [Leptospira kmetyi]TGK33472.1 CbtB-domain containing protein [Leptospira kmetyi]